jgi:tetratricopeptide (TPR) repeat protein
VISDKEVASSMEEVLESNDPADQHYLQPTCTTTIREIALVQPGSKTVLDWKVVDVIGSPRLCRLIGALTVEACDAIPFLDLARDDLSKEELSEDDLVELCYPNILVESEAIEYADKFRTNASSRARLSGGELWLRESRSLKHNSPINTTSWICPLGSPYSELCPFPQVAASNNWTPNPEYLYPITSSEWPEAQCRTYFKKLAYLNIEELKRLIARMASLAFKCRRLDQFDMSEKWHRYIVTATERMRNPRPCWILRACLGVIADLRLQGRFAEARDLHQDFHIKVERIFGPNHLLTLSSKAELAVSLRSFRKQEEEKIRRELLQSYLNFHGTGYHDSMVAIHSLALLLLRQKKFLEGEQLLMTVIDLRSGRNVLFSRKPSPDTILYNERTICDTMLNLVRSLTMRRKHTRSKDLLDEIRNRFSNILELEGYMFFNYQYMLAHVKGLTGELNSSEVILRDLLRLHGTSMSVGLKTSIITALARILKGTDRLEEAISCFETGLVMSWEYFGHGNPVTKSSCRNVGLCYAELGRYDEALVHFERMIERIVSEDFQSISNREEYIKEINGWLCEVEDMRAATLG